MPLKKSAGQMYPWVTHTHAHLGGECIHKCSYCYVDNPKFGRPEKFSGPLRLLENEFTVNYGDGKTIFIEHMNDGFAKNVPKSFIDRILEHCCKWQNNRYVFQTKNPERFTESFIFPNDSIFGTTIETNREIESISEAPTPVMRYEAMKKLPKSSVKFLTIEPVLDFDVDVLMKWIVDINPNFLNLGADSKNHNLPEPTLEKILELTAKLHENGVELREKHNLDRLKKT